MGLSSPPIDPALWPEIETLLDEALELSPEEASAFLDRSCGEDAELRRQVEALLEADRRAEGVLDLPAGDNFLELLSEPQDGNGDGDRDDVSGRRYGPYQVLRPIGSGGMGDVYQARDTRLERSVALKLLPPEWSRHPEAKTRFLREARAVSKLEHPNVCTVHDMGETDDGRLFLVMGYYPGRTLADVLSEGAVPADRARRIAIQVARGLAAAHSQGIVHRDIKPGNVILTDQEEVKILDFGIARTHDDTNLTRTGATPGTPAYMAPEQARGEEADPRSDLWSLGILLYEMLTGAKPFHGANHLATLRSIVDEDPKPLAERCPDVPEDLRDVVLRLLQKNPEARYQTAMEVLTNLETSTSPDLPQVPRRRSRSLLALAALLFVGLLAAFFYGPGIEQPSTTSRETSFTAERKAASTSPRTLAVLHFQNSTRDEALDWLRLGIPDMLVTELSQSAQIQVLSTSRLHQILDELDERQPGPPDLGLIRRIAERAEVASVARGSFARVGDLYRLSMTVEDVATGAILASKQVEGRGEESLFALVDELSAAVRNGFEVERAPDLPENVQAITTASIDAWRLFSESRSFIRQGKVTEAIALLEEAVEIDPQFALALVNLGQMYQQNQNLEKAHETTGRAMELLERLPKNIRITLQAPFYASRWQTKHLAVESLEEALRIDPENQSSRNNLAGLYAELERYEEALSEYRRLTDEGTSYGPTYGSAAYAYSALDRFETGYRLLLDYSQDHPEQYWLQLALGWHLTDWGRYSEAGEALDRADRLRPGDNTVLWGRWRLEILTDDWPQARQTGIQLQGLGDPFSEWRGALCLARSESFAGRSEAALEKMREAIEAFGPGASFTALARGFRAELLLSLGRPEEALRDLALARQEGEGDWPELFALFLEGLAHLEENRPDHAQTSLESLRDRMTGRENRVEKRQILHLEGRLAHHRGDLDHAIHLLRTAADLLSPRGVEFNPQIYPPHLPLDLDLAEALQEAGRLEEARAWLQTAIERRSERLEQPIPWVRAHLRLGQVEEQLGRPSAALEVYGHFLDHWQHGDLDREAVVRVQAALKTK